MRWSSNKQPLHVHLRIVCLSERALRISGYILSTLYQHFMRVCARDERGSEEENIVFPGLGSRLACSVRRFEVKALAYPSLHIFSVVMNTVRLTSTIRFPKLINGHPCTSIANCGRTATCKQARHLDASAIACNSGTIATELTRVDRLYLSGDTV